MFFRVVVLILVSIGFVLFWGWITRKPKKREREAEKLIQQALSDDGKDFY